MKKCKDVTLRKLDMKDLYFRNGILRIKIDGEETDINLLDELKELYGENEFDLSCLSNTEVNVDLS